MRYISSMAKQSTKRSTANGTHVTVRVRARSANRSRSVTTTFGEVTVRGAKPDPEVVESNIARSTQALERIGRKLSEPGVHLRNRKGVPRYAADENNPSVFIQRLDGKVTRGRVQDGQFIATE